MPGCVSSASQRKNRTQDNGAAEGPNQRLHVRILGYTAVVILLDQMTKLLVMKTFALHESIEVLGNALRFTYIENPGMAFGIRVGSEGFFIVFAALASAAIFVYLMRMRHDRFYSRLALALILGGAIGNLIDRILRGQVVDFIDVGIGRTRWPVFNVADMAVSIGMVLLIVQILLERDPETKGAGSTGGE
jgi:signal peptidase II